MAKVKQPYDQTRYVPWLRRDVDPGEVVEVPDEDLPAYVEAGWIEDKAQRVKKES